MISLKKYVFLVLLNLLGSFFYAQNQPPGISVNGRQAYCPLSQIFIAQNFTISDPDNTGISNFFIQISSGYDQTTDQIFLTGNHPRINSSWNPSEGRLTLSSASGTQILFSDLEAAVRSIVYQSSSSDVSGEKFFSFTIDSISFLPSNGHYYEYISQLNINWNAARTLAENRSYFGLQGYLATITSAEEAQLIGEQATGTGWIGGSDAATEGRWIWVTGPEAGTLFWEGGVNGSSPNFAFWNNGEPNNLDDEDYAHITDPSVGVEGSWNDLDPNGGSGLYIARGYIVEYGGMPDDPDVNISGSTSIFIPELENTSADSACGRGSVTLTANSNFGEILWYDSPTGGNLLATGNSFTTPILDVTTPYYATVSVDGCLSVSRTQIDAIVTEIPTILNTNNALICQGNSTTISAVPSSGNVLWYETLTSITPIFSGNVFTTPELFETTNYYAEASVNGCNSATRMEVQVEVDQQEPPLEVPSEVTLCRNEGSIDVAVINPRSDFQYTWSTDTGDVLTVGETASITEVGNYFVTATAISGCLSNPQQVIVNESEISTLQKENIRIEDFTNNNQVLFNIDNIGLGEYEFSLNNPNGPYSQQLLFENLSPGLHVLYIRDQLGCGIQSFQFSVLNYPRFFTPNDDGILDTWNLEGLDAQNYTQVEVKIFNRFGVLVATLDQFSVGWNGFYNGRRLSSDDYWFLATLTDMNDLTIKRSGHFSLIRP